MCARTELAIATSSHSYIRPLPSLAYTQLPATAARGLAVPSRPHPSRLHVAGPSRASVGPRVFFSLAGRPKSIIQFNRRFTDGTAQSSEN